MENSFRRGRAAYVLSLAAGIALAQASSAASAAAGDVGAILHTTDGGQTWMWQPGGSKALAPPEAPWPLSGIRLARSAD